MIGAEGYRYRGKFYRFLTRCNGQISGQVNMSAATRGLLGSISAFLLRISALCTRYRYVKVYYLTTLSIAQFLRNLCWLNEWMVLAIWWNDVDKWVPKFLKGNFVAVSFSPFKITFKLVWDRNGAFAVRTRLIVWDMASPLAIFWSRLILGLFFIE